MTALRERVWQESPPSAVRRPAAAVIQVRDAAKVFRTGQRMVTALDGVSIEVGADESVGLVGESGSGKTILARLLERASGGQITIDGILATDWASPSGSDRRKLRATVQIVLPGSLLQLQSGAHDWLDAVRGHRHPRALGRQPPGPSG